MKLVIVAVGRMKDRSARALLDEYYQRIRRYSSLEELEVIDDRSARLADTVDRVVSAHKGRAELVALEVTGKPLNSTAFAERVGARLESAAVPVFILGGATGIPEALSDRAAWKLSLGPMTLPHRLARITLAEQLYRAFTILRGEPYARED
ncbi:MAG: 23S rRNA (pseudouridine(1915)-N(3))-methyltransferase RlmH [Deltaproteobacteria bacterium]|nr:23S rRNA (pseudouridine(1915)-N(3))-methyltransferase RlmH [Deltaproteobacteria bacterium]